MTPFDDNFWWQFLMTIFDDNSWWQFLVTFFGDNFLWKFLMTFDIFWWQFLMTIVDNFWRFVHFLTIFLSFLTTETIDKFWKFWQLRTWIHDNLWYLTLNCDTGQHLQFLRCLNDGFPKDPCLLCGLCVVHFTDITKSKGDSCLSTMKLVPAIILLPSSLKKLTKSGYLLLSPLLSKQDLPKLVGQLFRVDIWRDWCDRRSC